MFNVAFTLKLVVFKIRFLYVAKLDELQEKSANKVCFIKHKFYAYDLTLLLYPECREYSKYTKVKRISPILLINAPEIEIDECGHKVVTLIVGGKKADRKEFPHMVRTRILCLT